MVREIVEQRAEEGYPNPEEEKQDLARMEAEAQELTVLAGLLVKKVQDGYIATRRGTSGKLEVGPEAEGVVPADKVEDLSKSPVKEIEDSGSISGAVSSLKTKVADSSIGISAEIQDHEVIY